MIIGRGVMITRLVKPTARPRRTRPMTSMLMLTAVKLRTTPAKNRKPPISMEFLRPNVLVRWPETREETMPARYNEETNMVSAWFLKMQYAS